MSITLAQLRGLIELGLDGDRLLAAVTLFERDASRDERDARSLSADRSRRYRDRKRDAHHVTERDASRDAASILTSLSDSPSGIQEVRKKNSDAVVGERRRKGIRLTDDWILPVDCREWTVTARSWDDERINREAERFKNHSLSKDRVHKNLMAAWRNWVDSPYQIKEQSRESDREKYSVGRAAERLIERGFELGPRPIHPRLQLAAQSEASMRLLSKG